MVSSTRATFQVTSALLVMFREKNLPGPEKSKNITKTVKIEGYNTRFQTFPGPKPQMPQVASYGHGRSLESSHGTWNEYMDAFTFISRQFWVSREMNKWIVQRLFKIMQMVSSNAQSHKSFRHS